MKDNIGKKGLSSIITTILLIALVIAMALIIFFWLRGISKEAITKFGGTNIQLVCSQVKFEASYSEGKIYISNIGNIPIYRINLKISKEGGYNSIILNEENGWPDIGLTQGERFSGDIESHLDDSTDKIVIIPVLIGSSGINKKMHTCEEDDEYTIRIT